MLLVRGPIRGYGKVGRLLLAVAELEMTTEYTSFNGDVFSINHHYPQVD